MPRYIDAEKAVARFAACLWGKDYDAALARQCIDDTPTADVVEVVRCKDCKHWEIDLFFHTGWCRGKQKGNPNWFCADGERREDVEETD